MTVPLDDLGATDLSDPRYRLSYLRDTGRSRFTADLSFLRRDIDPADPDTTGVFEETDLIEDSGAQEVTELSTGLEWGLTDPFGGSVALSVRDSRYVGTTDPDLTDSLLSTARAGLRFDVDPTLRFTVDVLGRIEEEADATDTRTESTRLNVGTVWAMAPDLLFDATLGGVWIETGRTILGMRTVTPTRGAEGNFGLVLERPNGSYTLSYDNTLAAVGRTQTLTVGRALELPRGAAVSLAGGVTVLPSGTEYAVGRVSYARETARGGEIGLSLDHSAAVNSADNDVQRTLFQARYAQELPGGASWSIAGSYIESRFVDPAENDLSSAQLALNYQMPINRDWDLRTGLSLRETREDTAGSSQSSTVFVSVERRFSWRP